MENENWRTEKHTMVIGGNKNRKEERTENEAIEDTELLHHHYHKEWLYKEREKKKDGFALAWQWKEKEKQKWQWERK